MRFRFPLLPAEFEIPDEWWEEAGMTKFSCTRPAYRSTAAAILVPFREIEPPFRLPEARLELNGFDRSRLVSVLRGFVSASEIEPVPLICLPSAAFPPAPFKYRVRNGYHRFYASVAAGFEYLPALVDGEPPTCTQP